MLNFTNLQYGASSVGLFRKLFCILTFLVIDMKENNQHIHQPHLQ